MLLSLDQRHNLEIFQNQMQTCITTDIEKKNVILLNTLLVTNV